MKVAVVALVLLAGCTAPAAEPEATPLERCTIEQPSEGTVRQAAEFDAFWAQHCTGRQPVVDFGQAIVVFHAWGEQPDASYRVHFDRFNITGDTVSVVFQRQHAEASCPVHPTIGYPTAVVMIEHVPEMPAVFIQHETRTVGCPAF